MTQNMIFGDTPSTVSWYLGFWWFLEVFDKLTISVRIPSIKINSQVPAWNEKMNEKVFFKSIHL
jgi:hypothetical protein